MDWKTIQDQIEKITHIPIHLLKLALEDWQELSDSHERHSEIGLFVSREGKAYYLLEINEESAVVFQMEDISLTAMEKQLLLLALAAFRSQSNYTGSSSKEADATEEVEYAIQEWLMHHLTLNVYEAVVPDQLIAKLLLDSTHIPLMIYGENTNFGKIHYRELKKLLVSFFETELVLIPLMEMEWLILVPETLLTASKGEELESIEEALTSISSGLHEMLTNEWVGECHLTIHYPLASLAVSLLSVTAEMQGVLRLGKALYPDVNIHLPWEMFLEKLLDKLPDAGKKLFLANVLQSSELVKDMEMFTTLENFFAQDCNVSETAKKMYMHRNTLLYRLDKFYQETGFDVRHFKDAMLVKIALLLYKATKST